MAPPALHDLCPNGLRAHVEQLQQKRVVLQERILTSSIAACGRAKLWEDALCILDLIISSCAADPFTFCAAISAGGKSSQWQPATLLLHDMRKGFVSADVAAFNAAISACETGFAAGSGVVPEGLHLFSQIIDNHLTPTVISYNATLSGLGKSHEWQRALHVFATLESENLSPDVVSFNAVITAAEKSMEWRLALHVFNSICDARLHPTIVSCNAAISACEKAFQWQTALALFAEMGAESLLPDALVLMTLIVYVFGILFVQAVDDHRRDPMNVMSQEELRLKDSAENYFGNLWRSMLSLFMSITGGVSWEQLLVPLHAVSPLWVFVFLFYVSFTIFAVLNVVTGVFCQSAIDSAQSDHDAVLQSILANKQAHIEKIKYLFNEIDAEDVGVITYQMFQDKVTTKEVQTYFESIDLDIWDAWSFFKLLDLDSGGAIEIEEFLMGCLRLRGSARAMDMAKLCHDQAWLIRNQSRFWSFVEEELTRTRSRLDHLTAQVHGV
eukprot:s87_g40.t3